MGKRLYVGNLSWDTTQDTLQATFGANGRSVTDCHIVTDRDTGRPRGFAFVTMEDEGARKAIDELNGKEFEGRTLTVNEARAKESRGGGGGGGGGHRGGGGGHRGGGGRW